MRSIAVTAHWDAESHTWWTDGDDVPGLCCQGQTFEELSEAVFALAPDLLVANGAAREGEQIEIVLTAEQRKTIAAAAA
jgi:predicted RNase H-like HicB family nuclease